MDLAIRFWRRARPTHARVVVAAQHAIWAAEGLARQRARVRSRWHARLQHHHPRSGTERIVVYLGSDRGESRRRACRRHQSVWQPVRKLSARPCAVDRVSVDAGEWGVACAVALDLPLQNLDPAAQRREKIGWPKRGDAAAEGVQPWQVAEHLIDGEA